MLKACIHFLVKLNKVTTTTTTKDQIINSDNKEKYYFHRFSYHFFVLLISLMINLRLYSNRRKTKESSSNKGRVIERNKHSVYSHLNSWEVNHIEYWADKIHWCLWTLSGHAGWAQQMPWSRRSFRNLAKWCSAADLSCGMDCLNSLGKNLDSLQPIILVTSPMPN